MSAIGKVGYGHLVDIPADFLMHGRPRIDHVEAEFVDPIAFMTHPERADAFVAFAFDGQIPEIAIGNYLGEHPERLVDGFTGAEKPEGCAWMNQSVIKSISNHIGSVLVELEPAGAAL